MAEVKGLKESLELPESKRNDYVDLRAIEELGEYREIVQLQRVSATQFRGEFEQLCAPVCELTESNVLELRRNVGTVRSAVCELKDSSELLTIAQGVQRPASCGGRQRSRGMPRAF